jgi:hypothetical protein
MPATRAGPEFHHIAMMRASAMLVFGMARGHVLLECPSNVACERSFLSAYYANRQAGCAELIKQLKNLLSRGSRTQ